MDALPVVAICNLLAKPKYLKSMNQYGNLPGRRVFWKSSDRRTQIIRYCDGVFGLEYDGNEVMPESSFERINAYAWAEFITL